jgi:allophanate hydrolase subunit 1
MPTGWYVIGQTPVRVFDPARARPFLTNVGDEIVFERIDLAAFKALQSDAAAGALVARQETN